MLQNVLTICLFSLLFLVISTTFQLSLKSNKIDNEIKYSFQVTKLHDIFRHNIHF